MIKLGIHLIFCGILFSQSVNQKIEIEESSYLGMNDSVVSVKDFGAKGNGITDDLNAIQSAIITCSKEKKICYFPKGTYLVSGDIWLRNNVSIKGEGENSVIKLTYGAIRALKAGKKNFYYTNNYNNEIIPIDNKIGELNYSYSKGATKIKLDASNSQLSAGDVIYSFNGKNDSWSIFENKSLQESWNPTFPDKEFACGQILEVLSLDDKLITIKNGLDFPLNKGDVLYKQVGSNSIKIENIKIISFKAPYTILLEQPFKVSINNVIVESKKGGINLSNHAYKCAITNCKINAESGRAILIENFSASNLIKNNKVVYKTGGDAAVMLLMNCYNNNIQANNVTGKGNGEKNEGGIFVHALCHDNRVEENIIQNCAEGLGAYYSAYNNFFINNTVENVRVGYVSYYAQKNLIENNKFRVYTLRPGNKVGILLFGDISSEVSNNTLDGEMLYGVQVQVSADSKIVNNKIEGKNANSFSFGIKGIKVKSNRILLEGNDIKSFKTPYSIE